MKQTTLCVAFATLLAMLVSSRIYAQSQDISSYEINAVDSTYSAITFSPAAALHPQQAANLIDRYYKHAGELSVVLSSSTTTPLGIRTDRFTQFYKGLRVELSSFTFVSKEDIIRYATSNYYRTDGAPSSTPGITERFALGKALEYTGAARYMWQDTTRENMLKRTTGRPDTTFYPKSVLVWIEDLLEAKDRQLHLAYAFNIYALEPLTREIVYVDAHTGKILAANSLLENTAANGISLYSGNVSFQTQLSGTTYVMQDATRGSGINTYNCAGGDGSVAYNITSGSTTFTTDASVDAHWGAEKVYDYWQAVHGRNSFNNSGATINSFVHYLTGYNNAFWDGYEIIYGDGTGISTGGFAPLVSLDVCAHEIGHAVCQYTSALVYNREAGAMNEGFSDIWGAVIENYANPYESDLVAKNKWAIGEEISSGALRRMDNPNLRGQPDTYGGTYWYSTSSCTPTSSNDYCGVHNNSGVLNYWFYLLTQGGSGTNDLSHAFSVTGVGITKAANIAYQTELSLTSTATYASCRTTAINAATLLYGPCSPEVEAVTRAWYAVGVGTDYVSSSMPSIAGASSVCPGSTTTLTIATTGGSWSSNNTAIATVNTAGTVTGISAGTATISYMNGGCYSTKLMTTNPMPYAGSLSGTSTVAAGSSTVFTASVAGGTWTSSNTTLATVSPGGVVMGIAAGTANISYAVTNSCGAAYALKPITVTSANTPPAFTGGSSLVASTCSGSGSLSLNALLAITDPNAGQPETWTVVSGPAHGSLSGFSTMLTSTGGVVTPAGLSYTPATGYSGSDMFLIAISDGISSSTSTVSVVISPAPVSGTLSGASTVAAGATTPFSASVPGGSWTSSDAAIATVTSSGIVYGTGVGTANITYSVSNSCGTSYTIKPITVILGNVAPMFAGGSTQTMSICSGSGASSLGSLLTVTDPNIGQTETWTILTGPAHGSLSGFTTAMTSTGGMLTPGGVTYAPTAGYSGSDVFTIQISDGVAAASTTVNVVVSPLPAAGVLSGASTIAAGSSTVFTATSPGGTWVSSNTAVATVTSSGLVTGITSGAANISYIVSNSCGVAYAVQPITVSPTNTAPVFVGGSNQSVSVCANSGPKSLTSMMTISDPNIGQTETWSVISSPAHGSLSGFAAALLSTGGTLAPAGMTYTPVAGYTGADAFTIRVSDGIAVAMVVISVSVLPPPYAGSVTGPSSIPTGGLYLYSSPVPGGVWSSSNNMIATISATTGVASGVSGGTVIFTYSVANGCATANATKKVNIRSSSSLVDSNTVTGTGDVKKDATIEIFPNPSSGTFTLNTQVNGRFQLFDQQGRLISECDVKEGSNSLAFKFGLPPGLYFAKFSGSDGSSATIRLSYRP